MTPGTQAATRFCLVGAAAIAGLLAAFPAPFPAPSSRTVWTVAGDSMAPALCGPGLRWQCPECGFEFSTAPADEATCPNCAAQRLPSRHARFRAADRCLVRPVPRQSSGLGSQPPLKRLDVIAAREHGAAAGADAGGKLVVKRIYGLPGEQVALREGDLWINGRRWQKSLEQFRRAAVLVHDSRWQAEQRPRWERFAPTSWRRAANGWVAAERGKLCYLHRRTFTTTSTLSFRVADGSVTQESRQAPSPAYDHYAYNASLSRQLHTVHDLVVDVRVKLSGVTSLDLGRQWPQWTAHAKRSSGDAAQWRFPANGGSCRSPLRDGWRKLTIGVIDGRRLLAIDRQVIWSAPAAEAPRSQRTQPLDFCLAFDGPPDARCQVRSVQIWRDLHLYAPLNSPDSWQLGDDEWFVLGDNLPASLDSRQLGPLKHTSLLGVVQRLDE